jgi:hypothetical protein
MALLFIDGFDHYATADITKKWATAGANNTIESSSGRRSGGALRCTSTDNDLTRTFAATSTVIVGFAINPSAYAANGQLIQLMDSGTVQCTLFLNTDGTLSVFRSTSTAVTDGTSVASIPTGSFSYIEFKVTIADSISAGSCKVRLNGVDIITVATGQDLKATSNTTANSLRLSSSSTLASTVLLFDDFYLCDATGSTNNDFLGDVRVDAIYPTADGNYSQFTPSTGSDHYALVDETTPNTTDYNDGTTVGHRDSYAMGNLSALTSQTVYGVQVNAAILKDDAGAKSAATFVRSSSTNGDGASAALSTSQVYVSQVFETDPNGSIAWTETTVNAMEAGVLVTA